nr:type III-B CRISPR module RAMP protein Cmr4 [Ktedonobacteraceae bacterium]
LSFVHVISSLHAGTGQGAGIIDLPIAREKVTGIPFLPGSSLKGALSTRCYNRDGDTNVCRDIFGPKEALNDGNARASLAQFSDQKLLLLPVRSLAGIFAWITSPYVLYRLLRDISDTDVEPPTNKVPTPTSVDSCYVVSDKSAIIPGLKSGEKKVYLEDLDLKVDISAETGEWAEWLKKQIFPDQKEEDDTFTSRFCIVHDDLFSFLLETATEVNARIRLEEETKTVREGALWYEETLPPETILSGLVLATLLKDGKVSSVEQVFSEIGSLAKSTIQLGGKATVGRGLCRIRLVGGQ